MCAKKFVELSWTPGVEVSSLDNYTLETWNAQYCGTCRRKRLCSARGWTEDDIEELHYPKRIKRSVA